MMANFISNNLFVYISWFITRYYWTFKKFEITGGVYKWNVVDDKPEKWVISQELEPPFSKKNK